MSKDSVAIPVDVLKHFLDDLEAEHIDTRKVVLHIGTRRHASGPCRHVFGRSVSDYRKISTEYARL
jgi:hypothetical protein